jgi:uncharacterized membrane protein
MNTALVIALLAVAISLGTALMASKAQKAKKTDKHDGGPNSTTSSDGGSSDCSPGDGVGCDGGGGGD